MSSDKLIADGIQHVHVCGLFCLKSFPCAATMLFSLTNIDLRTDIKQNKPFLLLEVVLSN